MVETHGRALDVPARAPWPPWARPGRFTRFGTLPEGKVAGVLFAGIHIKACPRYHVTQTAPRQASVVDILANAEVDIAIGRIRIPLWR
jgi:hypothetical protein